MTADPHYPDLRDAVAIVTGGASGIGAAMVRAFVAQGAHVGFLDIDATGGAALATELSAAGPGSARFLACDLTDIAALRRALAELRNALGPAAILVNNAANDRREEFESVEPEQFDWMLNVNLRHVFFACQAIAPQMRERGGGAIVNMTSGAFIAGAPDMPSYVTAKAGIAGLTNALARKLGPDNIRVNAVAPGAVRTERQMQLWHSEESMNALIAQQCIRRQLLPEDIARTVLFLASNQAEMISKQLILVNGGLR